MLYTTLFMWAVEVLGWELFMLAAASQPEKFHEHFLVPCSVKSMEIVTQIASSSASPFVFVHDDLASAAGPVFHPSWYDEWIFPHYPQIWKTAKQLGKKIIFVGDGNLSMFLPKLFETGVDGLMFETPATPIAQVIEHFGGQGKYFIGGISTHVLRFGTPQDVRSMVIELHKLTRDCPGFAIASGGGLHGDLPIENLIAYFDARIEINATPQNWKEYWGGQ
jgi:uroporphyrinogen-III decarboxylase